jgi:hypothetical protein
MKQVTVNAVHFKSSGDVESTKSTRHQLGYRLDVSATNDYPYDKYELTYGEKPGTTTLLVKNNKEQLLAKYELVPDEDQPE